MFAELILRRIYYKIPKKTVLLSKIIFKHVNI